jgi:hypothetical protein
VRVRQPPPKLLRDRLLVRGIPEGEKQADRDGLGVDLRKRREVELLDQTVRADPLAHAEAPVERDKGRRVVGAEPVEVRAVLAP